MLKYQPSHKYLFFTILLLLLVLPFTLVISRQSQQIKQHAAIAGSITVISASDFQGTGDPMIKTTSDLAMSLNPNYVLTVGDISDEGTTATYQSSFTPTWGRMMSIIYPAPGNHDTHPGNLTQYMQYFNTRYTSGNAYYSVNLGTWHIVSLDSTGDIAAQTTWLQQDLAANPNKPILAEWHYPMWSTDSTHGNEPAMKPFWDALFAAHADIIVNGHVHTYQRYAQMDGSGNLSPNGVREFVDGTAGGDTYAWSGTDPKEEFRDNSSPGFIEFTLGPTSYAWQYVKANGQIIDAGSAPVHNASIASNPTNIPTTSSSQGITPTWVCAGGINCVPSITPPSGTNSPTSIQPITTIQGSASPAISQSPCTPVNYQSRDSRARHHHSHHKHGGNGNSGNGNGVISNLIQQLINLIMQLLNQIIAMLGGTPLPINSTPGGTILNPSGTIPVPSGSNQNPCPTVSTIPQNPIPSGTIQPSATIAVPNPTTGNSSPISTIPIPSSATNKIGPVTSLHYTSNSNFTNGTYTPGAYGFNIADVGSVSEVNTLPAGVKGLVDVNLCNGADANFISKVQPFVGNQKVWGYYLIDEPDPTGQYKTLCTPANLKAESDWIHTNAPGTKTFIILMNMSSSKTPTYANTYNPANSDIDLYGIDAYPCRTDYNGCDFTIVTRNITAAQASGIPVANIVPVYQAFGGGSWVDDGGGSYLMPTAAQENQLLATWKSVVPSPVIDYAYSWGVQNGDQALSGSASLQQVFAAQNK